MATDLVGNVKLQRFIELLAALNRQSVEMIKTGNMQLMYAMNDTVEEMEAIRDRLHLCVPPERVELLPYHAMGEHKYAAIGRDVVSFSVPDEEKMRQLRAVRWFI